MPCVVGALVLADNIIARCKIDCIGAVEVLSDVIKNIDGTAVEAGEGRIVLLVVGQERFAAGIQRIDGKPDGSGIPEHIALALFLVRIRVQVCILAVLQECFIGPSSVQRQLCKIRHSQLVSVVLVIRHEERRLVIVQHPASDQRVDAVVDPQAVQRRFVPPRC